MSGRPSGQKVPPYVAELETHRHRGLDFIFITQNPRLIDVNLRSLIEHHTHYSKTSLGLRRKLEWSTGGAKDPDSRASIREALVSVYRLDKSVYGYYKSAEVHTKIRTKRSKAIYIAPVAILAVGAIKKRPVVIETELGDTIGIRHMMYLSLSYDHRIVDGSLGASFLTAVAKEFEKWDMNTNW